jgi:peptide/nickel transport system substrate-binding protein
MRRFAPLLLGCMATAVLAAPVQAETLRVGIATEPWDLDPAIRTDTGSGYLIQNIYDPLVEIGPDKKVTSEYAVADSWEWSNELKTLTLEIKSGITFHNGTKLTAKDVAYNINWQLDPDNNAPNKGLIGPVDTVEVKSPTKLVVNFTEPYPDALQNWARALDGIVPEGAHGERSEEKGTAGFAGTRLSRNPVGSGPYEFAEWVSGSHITLKRTDDYWAPNVAAPEKVVFEFIKDPAAKLSALISGSVDIVDKVPFRDFSTIKRMPGVETKRMPGTHTELLYLNLSAPPFGVKQGNHDNEQAVQRAYHARKFLFHAIDREEIADEIFYGMATIQRGPWYPDSEWTSPELSDITLHDEALARKHLKKAGYADGGMEFRIMATNAQWFVDVATVIQEQLRPYGVDVEVVPLDKSAFFDTMYETMNWEAGMEDWQLNNFSALSWLFSGYYRNNHNHNHWHHAAEDLKDSYHPSVPGHEKFAELYDKAVTEPDTEKRKQLVYEMQEMVTEKVIQVDMMFIDNLFAWRESVQGYGEGLTSEGDINLRYVRSFGS